jgi:hypothetical protein
VGPTMRTVPAMPPSRLRFVHSNWLARLANLLKDFAALDPKLGNTDFLHSGYISTMRKKLRKVTKEQSRREDSYEAAMRRALARKLFPKTDGRYLSREETHDRAAMRKASHEGT